MVEDVKIIARGRAGPFEVSNSPNDFGILHVTGWVIIEAVYQDAGVPSMGGLDQEMEDFEIIVVSRQEYQSV